MRNLNNNVRIQANSTGIPNFRQPFNHMQKRTAINIIASDCLTAEIHNPTRLFSIEPIGLGTERVEALSSYIVRLSNAHRVPVQMILKYEVQPISQDKYISSGTRQLESAAVNGSS